MMIPLVEEHPHPPAPCAGHSPRAGRKAFDPAAAVSYPIVEIFESLHGVMR